MITLQNIEIDTIEEILKMSPEECENHFAVARWGWEPYCVYCKGTYMYKLSGKFKRYKCGVCRKSFGVKVGTIFQGSHLNMKQWFLVVFYCNASKISSYKMAEIIGISQKSAYYAIKAIKESICKEYVNHQATIRDYIKATNFTL